ncbi:MAG: P1 family peptidase [Gemmatimonadota bacterium]
MRLRDLGLAVGTRPTGEANAVTDVPGVRVGHAEAPAAGGRTGLTVLVPFAGRPRPVLTGCYAVDGGAAMTGLNVAEDFGTAAGPIALAPAAAAGAAYEALIEYGLEVDPGLPADAGWPPLVIAVDDSAVNDPAAAHRALQPADLHRALAGAAPSRPVEGAVGIGAGLAAFGCRGGVGTASRRVAADGGAGYLVGALVAANGGEPGRLALNGCPVGPLLDLAPLPLTAPRTFAALVVTDAPLAPRQLDRLAGRAALGLVRVGLLDEHTREGLVLAQSTDALTAPRAGSALQAVAMLGESGMPALFAAAAEACEEAVWNALVAATGAAPTRLRHGAALPLLPLRGWPAKVGRPAAGG